MADAGDNVAVAIGHDVPIRYFVPVLWQSIGRAGEQPRTKGRHDERGGHEDDVSSLVQIALQPSLPAKIPANVLYLPVCFSVMIPQ